jgi:hypothetical protein
MKCFLVGLGSAVATAAALLYFFLQEGPEDVESDLAEPSAEQRLEAEKLDRDSATAWKHRGLIPMPTATTDADRAAKGEDAMAPATPLKR